MASFSTFIQYDRHQMISPTTQLPPTPSSTSSISTLNKDHGLSLKIPPHQQQHQQASYGSLGSSTPLLEGPPTPSHTTISPNENDEGLYLLWTQQLLRERGFKPSPCHEDLNGNDDDEEDDDSSVSDASSDEDIEDIEHELQDDDLYLVEQRRLSTFQSHHSYIQQDIEDVQEKTGIFRAFYTCFSCLQ